MKYWGYIFINRRYTNGKIYTLDKMAHIIGKHLKGRTEEDTPTRVHNARCTTKKGNNLNSKNVTLGKALILKYFR
ncbi:hypothetical protein POVCU2_0011460 [Plasmodium ovale curtisi]|uniref:Uncharacterized protein n=1 Tax=Plasmodium ovale curtisi TaxID=864141 RepID=A0A1A8VPU0_PLAOA|nr:hypothetical protein POVCU2_0011460 [Plasmodium ovale curtisi]